MRKVQLVKLLLDDIAENGDDYIDNTLILQNEIVKLNYYIAQGNTKKETFSCVTTAFDLRILKEVREELLK